MKQVKRLEITWPVFVVTVAAAFMVAMDRFRIAWLVGAAALGSAAISSFHRRPAVRPVAVPVALVTADAAA